MSGPVVTRAATASDADFVAAMLAEAASWDRPTDTPAPSVTDVLRDPRCADYVVDWGRPGDAGVIAEVGTEPVAACWLRTFTADHPGYGYLGEDVPGLGLAVRPGYRRRGIGGLLLDAVIAGARRQGVFALSLSVAAANTAARSLYERFGFVTVEGEGGSLTMRLDLDAR
jgi:ribosomal protein S18 acetylase RimI-like enzyme